MTNTLLCCDWGTSSLRLRWVDTQTRAVLADIRSREGIAGTFTAWQAEPVRRSNGPADSALRQTVYKRVLANHITRLAEQVNGSLAGVPLVLSGMASSSIGLIELPYAQLPFAVNGSGATTHRIRQTADFPHDILLISGVRSEADVMRGEETQLVGLYQLCQHEPAFAGEVILLMPGTHSKHITVRDELIVDFRTYMTGELFALLGQYSILNDSVQSATDNLRDWTAFRRGVQMGAASNLLNSLFSVRTNQLFERHGKIQNYAYLSGLLIGSELRELTGANQPERRPQLILGSSSHIVDHYQQAADELALSMTVVPTDLMEQSAVAGQLAIFEQTNRWADVPVSTV